MRKKRLFTFLTALTTLGMASASQANTMDLVLSLQPKVSMLDLANSVLNPSSPRFHRFYTPQEIMEIAGWNDMELNQLAQRLAAYRIEAIPQLSDPLTVTIRGDSTTLQQLFSTRVERVSFNQNAFMNVTPVIIPAALQGVASVSGFNTAHPRRPKWSVAMGQGISATPQGLLPAEIRDLYDLNPIYQAGITGRGQNIAIATYGGFYLQDVAQYFAKIGISPAPMVDIVSFDGAAPVDPQSAIETQVDTEFSGMIAPGASIHVFTSTQNNDAGEVQLFTAILDDGRAKVVNYSWGSCEAEVTAQHRQDMDNIFARAIAQGVNIMIASGDSGSAGCDDNKTLTSADFPASSPMVIAVGGTSVSLGSQGGPATETAWSCAGGSGCSGGGYSQFYPAPAWQASYVRSRMRGLPDVAFNADPKSGEPAFVHNPDNGQTGFITIGGTSIAAPQWTGLLALVGQARASRGPIGALGPIIYGVPGADMSQLFHDVTQGSNGAYSAGPGWDPVTGLGSPISANLVKYLSGI